MPLDCTHDVSFVDYHMSDLESFGKCLQQAVNGACPITPSKYRSVHALLICWQDDPLGVIKEVDELGSVFERHYFFEVVIWRIPSQHPYRELRKRLSRFLDEYESKDNLLLVYYGGREFYWPQYGYMNDDRQCIWSCTGKPDSPVVQWSGLQNQLEQAESDVLILLDCCAAASSISESGLGVTEVIAACGFETWAPGVGQHSFTSSLTEELRWWSHKQVLTVAMLHNKVLSRLKYWKPRYNSAGQMEHRKTPVYIVLGNEHAQRSIILTSQRPLLRPLVELAGASQSNSTSDSMSSTGVVSESQTDSTDSSMSSLSQVWPDDAFKHPKVLLSLSLEEHQNLQTDEWLGWLKSVPAVVKYCHVEGVMRSGSTLLLISLPIAIWDLLPSNRALRFVSFIRSRNSSYSSPYFPPKLEGTAGTYVTAPAAMYRDDSITGGSSPYGGLWGLEDGMRTSEQAALWNQLPDLWNGDTCLILDETSVGIPLVRLKLRQLARGIIDSSRVDDLGLEVPLRLESLHWNTHRKSSDLLFPVDETLQIIEATNLLRSKMNRRVLNLIFVTNRIQSDFRYLQLHDRFRNLLIERGLDMILMKTVYLKVPDIIPNVFYDSKVCVEKVHIRSSDFVVEQPFDPIQLLNILVRDTAPASEGEYEIPIGGSLPRSDWSDQDSEVETPGVPQSSIFAAYRGRVAQKSLREDGPVANDLFWSEV